MTTATRRRVATAAALLMCTAAFTACSGDDGTDEPRTTHTTSSVPDATGDPAEALSEESQAALAAAEQRGAPTLEATGPVTELQITDDVVGDGAEVTPGSSVTVHYTGAGATSGEVFDSSWDRGEFTSFSLDQVIEGWGEGLVGMKVGGRRTLVIPAEQAYGDEGPAPGDSLVFVVDLIAVD